MTESRASPAARPLPIASQLPPPAHNAGNSLRARNMAVVALIERRGGRRAVVFREKVGVGGRMGGGGLRRIVEISRHDDRWRISGRPGQGWEQCRAAQGKGIR